MRWRAVIDSILKSITSIFPQYCLGINQRLQNQVRQSIPPHEAFWETHVADHDDCGIYLLNHILGDKDAARTWTTIASNRLSAVRRKYHIRIRDLYFAAFQQNLQYR